MRRVLIITICVFLLVQGGAFANQGEKHGTEHKADAQMQKLHHMMPMYAVALSKVGTALEKGDPAAVETEAGKMLATAPALKMAKPHKNLKQLKTYKNIAAGFEKDLRETVTLAKHGDFANAKSAFQRAEAKCAACHAKFRD